MRQSIGVAADRKRSAVQVGNGYGYPLAAGQAGGNGPPVSGQVTRHGRGQRDPAEDAGPSAGKADRHELHAGAFDLAYLGCLPGFVLMAAADEAELKHMLAALGAKSVGDVSSPEALTCSLRYNLPGDVGVTLPTNNHPAFDKYSWATFQALNAPGVGERLATIGDNRTQWEKWSSTESLIQCAREPDSPNCVCPGGDCFASGARYYPDECMTR